MKEIAKNGGADGGLYNNVLLPDRHGAQLSGRSTNGISELEDNNGRKEIQQTADAGTVREGNVGDNALDTASSARGRGQSNTGRSIRGASQTGGGRSVRYENLTVYMKPTEQQVERLLLKLKELGVDRTTAENVVGRTYEYQKMETFLNWLNHGNPTVNEICAKSREIARAQVTTVQA